MIWTESFLSLRSSLFYPVQGCSRRCLPRAGRIRVETTCKYKFIWNRQVLSWKLLWLETAHYIPGIGCRELEIVMHSFDAATWKLECVTSMLDSVTWKLDYVTWKLDCVTWILDSVTWKLGCVTWILGGVTWKLGCVTWKYGSVFMGNFKNLWKRGKMAALRQAQGPCLNRERRTKK